MQALGADDIASVPRKTLVSAGIKISDRHDNTPWPLMAESTGKRRLDLAVISHGKNAGKTAEYRRSCIGVPIDDAHVL